MNTRIAIIIDNIEQAKRQGLYSQFKSFLKKKFCRKSNVPIFLIENGDAFVLEINQQQPTYSIEKQVIQYLTNGYIRKPKAALLPEENTFFFMKNYNQIITLLSQLLDVQDEEQGVVRFVVDEPVQPVVHFKYQIREKIKIFERFVKIGWNTYSRRFDLFRGLDYIVVDGQTLYIRYDRHGREYLDV